MTPSVAILLRKDCMDMMFNIVLIFHPAFFCRILANSCILPVGSTIDKVLSLSVIISK